MCHSRHRAGRAAAHQPSTTGERAPEPVIPEPHDLRASDAERERTVDALRAHAAAGRLDAEELEERLAGALGAARRADLAALLADLPAPQERPRPAAARPRQRHGKDPRAFVPIAILLVAIWALTGAGYFWPVWPLLWFAFAGLLHFRPGHARVIGHTSHTR
jgi:hypothetical protein